MDLELLETGNGGDLIKGARDISVIEGFQNMIYLALFGGNPGHVTPENRIENTQDFSWWGNNLFFRENREFQFNSLTEQILINVPLNSSGALKIEQSIYKDLEFMNKFAEVNISVSIVSHDKVEIIILVRQPDNQQDKEFVFIWDSTKQELEKETQDNTIVDSGELLPPSNLTIDNLVFESVTVYAFSNSGGLETGFEWQLSDTNDFSNILQTNNSPSGESVPQTTFSFTETGLLYIRVRAVGDQSSDWSNTLSFNSVYDFGLALSFDGINDWLDLGSQLNGIPLPREWSVSLWVNFQSVTPLDMSRIFQCGVGGTVNRSISLDLINSGSSIDLTLSSSGQFVGGVVGSPVSITLDSDWHNIVVSKREQDAENNVWNMYLDGVKVINEEVNDENRTPSTYGSNDSVMMSRGGSASPTRGWLDNFAIVHRELSESDVSEVYSNRSGSAFLESDLGLFVLYKFNKVGAVSGGDNTSLSNDCASSSSNNYTGTLMNSDKIGVISNWITH